jgi:hypothetical protein
MKRLWNIGSDPRPGKPGWPGFADRFPQRVQKSFCFGIFSDITICILIVLTYASVNIGVGLKKNTNWYDIL